MKPDIHTPVSRSPRDFRPLDTGFTLTELLVVILIVVVLAAIALTVVRNAVSSADRAACAGIMRQLGVATATYISDNNGVMPGPIGGNGQAPNYRRKNDRAIFGQLHEYFGLEEKPTVTALPENLVCPAYRRRCKDWNSDGTGTRYNVFTMNQDQEIHGTRIWGSQNTTPGNPYGPMRYGIVANGTDRTPVSKIIYLADECPTELKNPVHGSYRNFLFLDFHVESLPASPELTGGTQSP